MSDEKLLKLLTELLAGGRQDNNISAISKLIRVSLDADLDCGGTMAVCKKLTNSTLLRDIKTFFDKRGNFKSDNSANLLRLLWRASHYDAGFCEKLIEEKVHEVIVSYFTSHKLSTEDDTFEACLNILHNVLQNYSESQTALYNEKLLKVLTGLTSDENQFIRATSLLLYAYIVDLHAEDEKMSKSEVMTHNNCY